jgi:hypothetical protein
MKHLKMNRPSFVLILALLVLLASVVLAEGQVGASPRVHPRLGHTRRSASAGVGYDVSWWTADGGGATFNTGRGYALGSTAGQPDAAVWAGDGYTLTGGFWGGAVVEYHIYLPLVLRDF